MSEYIDNRFDSHPPRNNTISNKVDNTREAVKAVAVYLDQQLPDSREKSLAITNLETVMFWSLEAITRNQPEVSGQGS